MKYWTNFSGNACGLGQLIIFRNKGKVGTFLKTPQHLRDTNGDLRLLQALQGQEKRSNELRYLSDYSCKVCATHDTQYGPFTLLSILAVSSAQVEDMTPLLLCH